MKSKKLGNIGEEIATKWLLDNDFEILEKNFTIKGGEIDIITKKENRYYFVEVKLRKNEDPLDSINKFKLKKIEKTAIRWIDQNTKNDIIWSISAILIFFTNKEEYKIEWIEDFDMS